MLASAYAGLIEHPLTAVRQMAWAHVGLDDGHVRLQLDATMIYAWSASFAQGAGATLHVLARASSVLDRRAVLTRNNDAEARAASED